MKAYLPAVIRIAERQREKCDRLIKYCYELDGTKLDTIEGPGPGDNLPYPQRNDAAFHEVAAKFAGKAFLWMEPDAIPTRAGWLADLTAEYRRLEKPIMLPDMSNTPKSDVAAGIGVYPPETSWLIPKTFERDAWDMWLLQHCQSIISRTPMIRHSYGAYLGGQPQEHRFPRDNALLGAETRLFHRDVQQDIITLAGYEPLTGTPEQAALPEGVVMRHGGDMGDIIAALPLLRHRGGGKIVLFFDPSAPKGQCGRESLEGARFQAIKPLLEAQHYVTSVEWGEGLDTGNFRTIMRPRHESLTERQGRHCNCWPVKMHPWLEAPGYEKHDRIVMARSARYHGKLEFPWKEIVAAYGDRALFVGLPDEHKAFEEVVGRPVEHAQTENLLDVAKLIAGSGLGYFNQSCPLWIALGLGTRVVVEVNSDVPNSSLPINPRSFFAESHADIHMLRRSLTKFR